MGHFRYFYNIARPYRQVNIFIDKTQFQTTISVLLMNWKIKLEYIYAGRKWSSIG